jgi:hypothetical protein
MAKVLTVLSWVSTVQIERDYPSDSDASELIIRELFGMQKNQSVITNDRTI